ncbi:MAG TPA: hypothetical protein VN622_02580 [Clostridia bacterium]|nr:hypothetical protein [Clostridia bacterium]
MTFKTLQDALRQLLADRIEQGEFTGIVLASRAGFKQAHISNFLNHKRGLSLEGMDRILHVLKLSVLDLVNPAEINKRASIPPPPEREYENVVLVPGMLAASAPLIQQESVADTLKFKRSFLRRLRPDMASRRDDWLRFVLIKVDAEQAMAMYPRMMPNATLLLDRHYNSLKPYRRNDRTMYAVRKDRECVIRYVELQGRQLSLRPQNDEYPLDFIPIAAGKTFADYIIGRVCHVGIET